jgi:branched-chain amino acid transport system substrate-binding protein
MAYSNLLGHTKVRIRQMASLMVGAIALCAIASTARADINVGVILSTTGPAASLGIPEEQTIRMWPSEMAGEKVNFIILNDASDTTGAVRNASKLITENNVDVIIGPSVTPTSMAALEVAGSAKVPMVSLAGGGAIVLPQTGVRTWAFKLSPTEPISINLALDHFQAEGQDDGHHRLCHKLRDGSRSSSRL